MAFVGRKPARMTALAGLHREGCAGPRGDQLFGLAELTVRVGHHGCE